MYKRILRGISAILVLAMLTEMLPTTLLGNLVQLAAAVTPLEVLEGTSPSAPAETPSSWEVDIPPTLVEGEEVIFEEEMVDNITADADSVQTTATESGSEDFSAPYYYQYNEHESVSLQEYKLNYQEIDYVLPGANGLDLVIGREFNSSRCSLGSFDSQTGATSLLHPAVGWNLMFPWIKGSKLYLTDGRVVTFGQNQQVGNRVPNRVNQASEKVYPEDVIVQQCRQPGDSSADTALAEAYSNGAEDAQYRALYANGKQEYFSSAGNLIGILDRYGNEITLVYEQLNGRPCITITDTLGRIVRIYEDETGSIRVDLPDNQYLLYMLSSDELEDLEKDGRLMASYQNVNGDITQYSYTLPSSTSNQQTTDNLLFPLTTVTHPNRLQTVFSYYITSSSECKLQSRLDRCGEESFNQIRYAPGKIEYASGLIRWYQLLETEGTLQSETLQIGANKICFISYRYTDNWTLPSKKSTTWFSSNSSTPNMTIAEAYSYNNWGLITEEWSSLAEGNTANTEFQTTYTYDDTYNLLLSKTYKTDADTTIELRNTLDDAKKSIIRTEVYVNDVLASRTDYTYDSFGNVTSEKRYHDDFTTYDLTEYSYQDHAYLSQKTHSGVLTADGAAAVSTPGYPSGTIATSYAYDALGRMISVTDGRGNMTSYAYDVLGNVTQITNPDGTTVFYNRDYISNTVTVTDENGAQVKYTYNPLGLEFETIDVQTGSVITRKEYDSMSRLIKVSDFVYGAVTEYAYDALDRVISETIKQGDVLLSQTLYAYDDAAEDGQYQKVTKTIVGDENAPSIVTTQYTDKTGNVVKTGKFLNGVEYFDTAAYDYVGNVITQLTAADAANSLEYTAKYEYNGLGQAVKTYNAENQYTTNTYNALGQLVETTDFAGTPTSYSYDALGRLLTQTITIDTGVTAVSKYDYDASGNIIREYKPNNAVGSPEIWSKTEYAYDNRQNLVSVQQYDGGQIAGETSYTYDPAGNLLSMTAGGNTTSYTYDRYGNVLTMTDALGQQETYTYNALGRPMTKMDRNGQVTEYAFDALGRPVSTTAGTGEDLDTIQYTYTLTGQVRMEQTNNQRTIYTYDELGQVIQVAETEQRLLIERASGNAAAETSATTSSAMAAPAAPDPDDNKNRNWNKVKETYLEKKLKKQGTNPYKLKEEYLGRGAELKKYDIYMWIKQLVNWLFLKERREYWLKLHIII